MGSLFASAGLRSAAGQATIWNPPATEPGPAPTPDRFTVERCEKRGRLFVSIVTYPGCTNFEGRKCLVTQFDPRECTTLDPHFLPHNGLIARFVPSDLGFAMARRCADLMSEEYL